MEGTRQDLRFVLAQRYMIIGLVAVVALLVGCSPASPTVERPTPMPTATKAEIVVLETPARIRRYAPVVWAGALTPVPIPELQNDSWQTLEAGHVVTTDNDGEGQIEIEGCLDIFVFRNSELVVGVCPGQVKRGGNLSCAAKGAAVYSHHCLSQVIIQTLSAEIEPQGTWLAVTYLEDRELSLVMVFDGGARVQPVQHVEERALGEAIDMTAGNFWFTTPGDQADSIAGLAAREPYPFDRLPPLADELDLWPWLDRIKDRAEADRIPFPDFAPTPTVTPTPTETPTATPTPMPTPCVPSPPYNWRQYMVQPGNTLYSLGMLHGTSVQMIQRVNCLVGDGIQAGQSLWLPALPPTPTPTITPTAAPQLPDLTVELESVLGSYEHYDIQVTITNRGPVAVLERNIRVRYAARNHDAAHFTDIEDAILSVSLQPNQSMSYRPASSLFKWEDVNIRAEIDVDNDIEEWNEDNNAATIDMSDYWRYNTPTNTPTPTETPTVPPTATPVPASVAGTIWLDRNGDQERYERYTEEPPLRGITVTITDSQGSQSVQTDDEGNYTATVASGRVTIDVDLEDCNPPYGCRVTTGNDPAIVDIGAGGVHPEDFGIQYLSAEVYGQVWLDRNGDQERDGGEPVLPGITFTITDSQRSQSVQTNDDGIFTATVASGRAMFDVDIRADSGCRVTTDDDPKIVTIAAGGPHLEFFGIQCIER